MGHIVTTINAIKYLSSLDIYNLTYFLIIGKVVYVIEYFEIIKSIWRIYFENCRNYRLSRELIARFCQSTQRLICHATHD